MLQSEIDHKEEHVNMERVRYEESLSLKEKQLVDEWQSKLRKVQNELVRSIPQQFHKPLKSSTTFFRVARINW